MYFFFATFMLISIPYVYFLVPETKGIPLEDVNALFRKGLKPRHAHPVVLAEIRQRHEQEVSGHFAEDLKTTREHSVAENV